MTGLAQPARPDRRRRLTVLAWQAWRGKFSKEYYTPVEVGGLYWHFVDHRLGFSLPAVLSGRAALNR